MSCFFLLPFNFACLAFVCVLFFSPLFVSPSTCISSFDRLLPSWTYHNITLLTHSGEISQASSTTSFIHCFLLTIINFNMICTCILFICGVNEGLVIYIYLYCWSVDCIHQIVLMPIIWSPHTTIHLAQNYSTHYNIYI